MTTVGVHEAKTRFSELLRRAEGGEDVVVTRGGRPVARLSALRPGGDAPDRFGMLAGEFADSEPWDDDPELPELFGITAE